jgi:ABC-type transport system involved in cytochrome c biogenesis permease subunit
MPMDTFARAKLLSFSGRSTFDRQSATAWMTRVLFQPEKSREDAVFLVNNPEVLEAVGLPATEGRERYSFSHLQPVMEELRKLAVAAWNLDKEARSPVERELVHLFNNLIEFSILSESFDFAARHHDFAVTDPALRADLMLPADQHHFSFAEIVQVEPTLMALWNKHHSTSIGDGNAYEQELRKLAEAITRWKERRRESLLQIIPLPAHGNEVWLSPWDALPFGSQDTAMQRELTALHDMVWAFRDGKQVAFDLAARTFLSSVAKRNPDAVRTSRNNLEVRYNKANLFYRAELLYGLAFLAALLSLMYGRRWVYRGAFIFVVAATLLLTLGILLRMKIMGRPPVTNLYTTFLFVGWVSALLGLVVEYFQRNRLGLLTASVSGLALLLTSRRFGADGDTMGVMVAVLDSNFWLATHVVTITIGYAGCCVAGLIGHIYLLQALRRDTDDPRLKETYSAMYGTLAFGLIFAFLGTMLGGIWADQSWGRFWGWDPKENGALVIVLWSAVLFHAHLARMIGRPGFAAGCVIGVVWVLLAWLGVNLLGTGLHSYGFTSGVARGLFLACGIELLFVAAILPFTRRDRPEDDPSDLAAA